MALDNVIIIAIVAILIGIFAIWFFRLSKEKQMQIIKEWLLLAVIKAEKELGDGTGQIKLRFVYDLFIDKFRFVSMFISFSQFSDLVDLALITMKDMIANNNQVKEYISK
jgi:hypothetical protein